MKHLKVLIFVLLLAVTSSAAAQSAQTPAEICAAAVPAANPATRSYTSSEEVLEPGVDYRAIFCTEAGPIYVDLFEDYAPVTVNSFVFLANQGFYNNTTFHRVIQNFMAQGGDPEGTGAGGPGYQFKDEFVGFLYFDKPDLLAMANANRPEQGIVGTNGSQFFITTVPTPHLDYRHTIFGEVLEGRENVANISLRDPATASTPGTALQTVIIITDPSTVASTYQAPASLTQAEVEAAFAGLPQVMAEYIPAEMMSFDEANSGPMTTEAVIAAATADARTDLADFLNRHHHQYRVSNTLLNATCDFQNLPFSSISYRIDSFATAEDAAAAFTDEDLPRLTLANGFTDSAVSDRLNGANVYTTSTTACGGDVITRLFYLRRGHLLVTVQATLPSNYPGSPDFILEQVAIIYERILSNILRPEIANS
jgi:cyclophilin family peptidyl-prolyl cis-trans isomerase